MSYRATARPIDDGYQPYELPDGEELETGRHQCAANALADIGHQIDRAPWPPSVGADAHRFEDCAPACDITLHKED